MNQKNAQWVISAYRKLALRLVIRSGFVGAIMGAAASYSGFYMVGALGRTAHWPNDVIGGVVGVAVLGMLAGITRGRFLSLELQYKAEMLERLTMMEKTLNTGEHQQ